MKENKIELKHLAPYLPYGLKFQTNNPDIVELASLSERSADIKGRTYVYEPYCNISDVKPILRPMADLHKNDTIKSIAFEQARSNNDDYLILKDYNSKSYLSFEFKMWLIQNHFDVFGLIEIGLAIDINTINDEKA